MVRRVLPACAAAVALAAATLAGACTFGNAYDGGAGVDASQPSFVGAAGATLVSADGLLTITVPPGAVTRDEGVLIYISGPSPTTVTSDAVVGQAYDLQPFVRFKAPVLVSLRSSIGATDFELLQLVNLDAFEPRVGGSAPAPEERTEYFTFTTTTGRVAIVRSMPRPSTQPPPACLARCCGAPGSFAGTSAAPCTCKETEGALGDQEECVRACLATKSASELASCVGDVAVPDLIACGETPCPILGNGSFCCVAGDASACVFQAAGASLRCQGAALACDGPEDCHDAGVCCFDSDAQASACSPSCTAKRLCHSVDDCAGRPCDSALLGGISACQ